MLLAIDPGPTESGYVIFDPNLGQILESGVIENPDMLIKVKSFVRYEIEILAMEKIVSYGKIMGQSTIDTCYFSGRLIEAWHSPEETLLIPRKKVLSYLQSKNDKTTRQACIDILQLSCSGKIRYAGVTSHAWSALAVAITASKFKKKI